MADEKKSEYEFFWGAESIFSTWNKTVPFKAKPMFGPAEELTFATVNHWMAYNKAMLFGDAVMAGRILASDSPKIAKTLGRRVKGFNLEKWKVRCVEISIVGNRYKFTQNANLKNQLIASKKLVFANPSDKIWGIGMKACEDPKQWKGENLLGQCLEKVKETIE